MAKVVKVLAWENPGPLGGDPRWDMEIVRADGSRKRVVGLSRPVVSRLRELASAAAGSRRVA